MLDPVGDKTAFFVQDAESAKTTTSSAARLAVPIVRDRLFFFGSYSPRNERQTNPYNFDDGTHDIERDIWKQQAFGKLTYAMRRGSASWSTLWTPTMATGTQAAYNGATPNSYTGPKSSLASKISAVTKSTR